MCEIVTRTDGFQKISLFSVTDEFGSLGTNTNYGSYCGTPLGVTDLGSGKLFPRGLLGGGL